MNVQMVEMVMGGGWRVGEGADDARRWKLNGHGARASLHLRRTYRAMNHRRSDLASDSLVETRQI